MFMISKMIQNFFDFFRCLRETFTSNLNLFCGAKKISSLDFVMQVQPVWSLYLCYTALRCAFLAFKYKGSFENPKQVWQKAQLYAGMKVSGLLVSQAVLMILGMTTTKSVIAILSWGCVLTCCSVYAYRRARWHHLQSQLVENK